MRYQKDADEGVLYFDGPSAATEQVVKDTKVTSSTKKSRLWYSIRPIPVSCSSFGTKEGCAAVSTTPEELYRQAEEEGWVGVRVDLWDESEEGVLVKVQYWWREEDVGKGEDVDGDKDGKGKGWRQCLHDILYLGVGDGSEGIEGEVRERGW